ncbi:MAG: hypothetical protein RLZZ200_1156 [Pseudomonadota bacterium]|jgi:cytochrome c-type biogenesis protein CcmH
MTAFLVLAGALALAACAFVALPLLRASTGPRAKAALAVVVALLLGGSLLFYVNVSTWSWKGESAELTPENMVGRLARRLDKNPEDLAGWLLLGKSYVQLERYPMAIRAYQRADRVAGGRSAEALTGLAEAMVLGNQGDLAGRPGKLFEQALALDPNSTKALFYSAVAALERGDKPLARERFATLLTGGPPPEVRRLIEQTIQNIDADAAAVRAPAARPARNAASSAAKGAVALKLHITLAPSLATQLQSGAPLFVSARRAGERGPPIAAKRLDAKFPQDVELLSTDAMMGGSGFSAGEDLEVTARVANGGGAIPKPGDPFGTVRLKAGTGSTTTILIETLTP